MALATGTRLGPYEVLAFIGAGGIGEVYRARDTKLGREIAIKTLRDAFVHDQAHLARFKREAQLLATLNHPNIAAIYNFEESNGLQYLVLELVPGKTLAELLAAGPLDMQKGLSICRQVAAALEAAHEKGLIHRDLKPANVKVTPEGKVKVLDFGLAKAFAENAETNDPSESSSTISTIGSAHTMQGAILGTAAYMSPEQARGQKVDKRTDIWSFGCVLYEALTGRRAFAGATVSDTIAMIVGRDPDWQALPVATPPEVISVLRRCLQKDSSRRLRDMGDVAIEIDEASTSPGAASVTAAPAAGSASRRKSRPIAWMLAILAALGIGGALKLLLRPASATQPTERVAIALPPGDRLLPGTSPVISPDGSHLVYAAIHSGSSQLYLRSMDRFDPSLIPGTQDAENPFFSPDGQSVGFFADGKLKAVSLKGGMPLTLCSAPDNRGGSWSPDNTIVFSSSSAVGLFRVSAAGGAPQPLTALQQGELSHRWPEILPGGKAVLFTIWTGTSFDDAQIGVRSLETGEQRVLVKGGSDAKYAPSGHVVYARAGELLAVPFDLDRLKVTGPPVSVLQGVSMYQGTGIADFSISAGGLLIYVPGGSRVVNRAFFWVDREGTASPLSAPPRPYAFPRLSPDGRQIAVGMQGNNAGVWLYDLARATLTKLTESAGNTYPVWTPSGKYVTFVSPLSGSVNLQWMPVDGTSAPERLSTSKNVQLPGSWSPNGQALAFSEQDPASGWDIWVLTVKGQRKAQPFLRTPFNEGGAMFSPDGRWLAYQSDESGRGEIYVRSYPGPGGKWQISNDGGNQPVWARGGNELFYRDGGKMMAVGIETKPAFAATKPKVLFEGSYETGGGFLADYDISLDGQRFLMLKPSEEEMPVTEINVVQNWFAELKQEVPLGKKQ